MQCTVYVAGVSVHHSMLSRMCNLKDLHLDAVHYGSVLVLVVKLIR